MSAVRRDVWAEVLFEAVAVLRYHLANPTAPTALAAASPATAEQAGEGRHAKLGDLARPRLPDNGVHQLDRHGPGVADRPQPLDDRREGKVAVAGEDAVGVAHQLAGDAGDVAHLDMGQGRGGQAVE